jgi:hypothetical protein
MTALLLILSMLATDAKGCAEVRKESRYVVGYDHIVHIRNVCEVPIRCVVKTSLNEKGLTQTIDPGKESMFLTWRGATVRDFEYSYACEKVGEDE